MSQEKKKTIIVDIDGTLSHVEHRLHHVKKTPKDWRSFFEAMKDDTPKKWCQYLIENIDSHVILLTGRPDNYRKVTEDWLKKYGVRYDKLYMRKADDRRPDTITKKEIYLQEIKPFYDVQFVIDDLERVIEMWRTLDLNTLRIYSSKDS